MRLIDLVSFDNERRLIATVGLYPHSDLCMPAVVVWRGRAFTEIRELPRPERWRYEEASVAFVPDVPAQPLVLAEPSSKASRRKR